MTVSFGDRSKPSTLETAVMPSQPTIAISAWRRPSLHLAITEAIPLCGKYTALILRCGISSRWRNFSLTGMRWGAKELALLWGETAASGCSSELEGLGSRHVV
jgi:hypothetical protein